MSTPAPVSTLKTQAQPPAHAASNGSVPNDSASSFSNVLDQQKKTTVPTQAPHASSSRNAQQHNGAQAARQGASHLEENASGPDKTAAEDVQTTSGGQVAPTQPALGQTVSALLLPGHAGKPLNHHAKTSMPQAIQTQEGVKAANTPAHAEAENRSNQLAEQRLAKKTDAQHNLLAGQAQIKTKTESMPNLGEPGWPRLKTPTALPAGAALTKVTSVNNDTAAHGLDARSGDIASGLKQSARSLTLGLASDNTCAFLSRVAEARRISNQSSFQINLQTRLAATTSERGTIEPLSGLNPPAPGPFSNLPSGSATVTTPLQHPEWGRNFSQQVSSFSQTMKNGLKTIELRLDPPELGPIRIAIGLSDNVAQASFLSPHAAVRQAVEQALPQLQEQLAQAGISLGQTSVGEQYGQEASNQPATGQTVARQAGSSTETANLDNTPVPTQRNHDGQVDTFA